MASAWSCEKPRFCSRWMTAYLSKSDAAMDWARPEQLWADALHVPEPAVPLKHGRHWHLLDLLEVVDAAGMLAIQLCVLLSKIVPIRSHYYL